MTTTALVQELSRLLDLDHSPVAVTFHRELRAELGLLAERFEALERTLRTVAADQSAGRSELEHQQARLLDSLATDRRRRERLLYFFIAGAMVLATAALVASFLRL